MQKKRDEKRRLLEIKYAIVYGTPETIAQVFVKAVRCKTINTVYVESRNGKFRKDTARLIRRTLYHSKKPVFHEAQITFTAQVMNYTRTNDALKVLINPKAALFKQKYHLEVYNTQGEHRGVCKLNGVEVPNSKVEGRMIEL